MLVDKFNEERTALNQRAIETANTNMKCFLALDTTSQAEGALKC
ncbi:hypothetical protein ABIB40_001079 [Pedobacter sp. UYP30]